MKKLILMVLIAFLLLACAASANKMNSLELGMTRDDVIQAMGKPSSTSEAEGILYLKYKLRDGVVTDDYYIRLIDGKVDAYGRFGEFSLGY